MTERTWPGPGGEWTLALDQIELQCGSCDPREWAHLTAPDGTRYTFELERPLPLAELTDADLARLAEEAVERAR